MRRGVKPTGDLIVVSTVYVDTRVQYRIVGAPVTAMQATPAEPRLEDGYIWLMRDQSVTQQ
jgi:ABC-2 type transport system ATP-binding protein